MNYSEYEKLLMKMPCTLSLEYHQAVMWLHPETLPLGVVSIGDAVGAVRIPSRARNAYGRMVPVITFRRGTFQWNDKVTDIVLPPTINEIKTGAFVGCTDLRRITIPKQVKKIGEDTFKGCDRLEDVYFEGSREDWEKILIVHQKREIEFGKLIPGSPVQAITSERLLHIPGNDALFTANLHFHCALPDDCEDTRTFREPKSKQQYELLDLARRCKSTRKAKLINLVCYYAEGLAAGREYELVLPEEKSGNPRFDKVICHAFVSDPLVSDVSCRFFFFLQGMYGTVENTLFSTNCSEPYDFGKENVTLADVQAEIAAIEKQIGGKVGYATAMSDQLKLKYLHGGLFVWHGLMVPSMKAWMNCITAFRCE